MTLCPVAPIVSGPSARRRPHTLGMNLRKYHVICTNPGGWQQLYIDAFATNREQAASHAMLELARMRHADWTIDLVIEAEAAA